MDEIKKHAGLLAIIIANIVFFCNGYQHAATASEILHHPIGLLGGMFSHANSDHLLGNMFFLSLLGFSAEQRLGTYRFLLLYFFCGILAMLGFWAFYPEAAVLGASGAIAGILAIYPFCQKHVLQMLITGLAVTFYFFSQFQMAILQLQGLLLVSVAALAHVAGGVAGILLFTLFACQENNKQA